MGFILLVLGMVLQFININWGHWYHFTNDDNAFLIICGVLTLYVQNSTVKSTVSQLRLDVKNSVSVMKPLTTAVQIFNKLAQEAARSRGYNR